MDRPAAQEPSLVRKDLAQLLTLSGPVVLSRLGIMAMGLVDAIVVGNYSAKQLGYHALAWAPTSVILTMAVGLMTGVQVMTARRIGEGRRDLTGAVLRRGLVYSFWIGIVSTVVLLAGGPAFMHVIGLEQDLADGATPGAAGLRPVAAGLRAQRHGQLLAGGVVATRAGRLGHVDRQHRQSGC